MTDETQASMEQEQAPAPKATVKRAPKGQLPKAIREAVKTNVSANVNRAIESVTGERMDGKSFRDYVRRTFGYTSGKHGEGTKFVWTDKAARQALEARKARKAKRAAK